ncbi:MAG: 3-dehydroquinate dehydratase [Gammaproteobacteria bacterium]|nr:3-dehydroquinate dehydratase [Gammaproteobacteria bacterium]
MPNILLINGPNLARLGKRKPDIYGTSTLREVEENIALLSSKSDFHCKCFSSNHEGEIIDFIDENRSATGIIINPGALMMSGWALRDALEDYEGICIEVHISNIWARENFRHQSLLSPVVNGMIAGMGVVGYTIALNAILEIHMFSKETETNEI